MCSRSQTHPANNCLGPEPGLRTQFNSSNLEPGPVLLSRTSVALGSPRARHTGMLLLVSRPLIGREISCDQDTGLSLVHCSAFIRSDWLISGRQPAARRRRCHDIVKGKPKSPCLAW